MMTAMGHDHVLRWNMRRAMESTPTNTATFETSCWGSHHVGLVNACAVLWNAYISKRRSSSLTPLPIIKSAQSGEMFGLVYSKHAETQSGIKKEALHPSDPELVEVQLLDTDDVFKQCLMEDLDIDRNAFQEPLVEGLQPPIPDVIDLTAEVQDVSDSTGTSVVSASSIFVDKDATPTNNTPGHKIGSTIDSTTSNTVAANDTIGANDVCANDVVGFNIENRNEYAGTSAIGRNEFAGEITGTNPESRIASVNEVTHENEFRPFGVGAVCGNNVSNTALTTPAPTAPRGTSTTSSMSTSVEGSATAMDIADINNISHTNATLSVTPAPTQAPLLSTSAGPSTAPQKRKANALPLDYNPTKKQPRLAVRHLKLARYMQYIYRLL